MTTPQERRAANDVIIAFAALIFLFVCAITAPMLLDEPALSVGSGSWFAMAAVDVVAWVATYRRLYR